MVREIRGADKLLTGGYGGPVEWEIISDPMPHGIVICRKRLKTLGQLFG